MALEPVAYSRLTPDHPFFKQPVLQHLFGKCFLEVMHLAAQVFDLARGRLAGGMPRKPPLASFQELLRPAVLEALGDPFPTAQLGDAVLAAQARKHNLDPSRKSGGALHRLHCFCLEFDGACEVQRRVPTDWIIEPIDVPGYGSFSLAS